MIDGIEGSSTLHSLTQKKLHTLQTVHPYLSGGQCGREFSGSLIYSECFGAVYEAYHMFYSAIVRPTPVTQLSQIFDIPKVCHK